LAGFGGGYLACPEYSFDADGCTDAKSLVWLDAHGVKPLQGWALRAGVPRVASQARQPWA